MSNRLVAVVCNLKPAKMRGIVSSGMVLCASNEEHTQVDPILIPDGSTIGSRIMVNGYDREPERQINPKKKIFERIAPAMLVNGSGHCQYNGVDFVTDKGVVTATITNCHIA
jgi:aminoacyl tRNA synthase complex-interacting multifunctional protein 1